MVDNFWQKLNKKNKPIVILAPMAGITDVAFRYMCQEYGADVVYSEMVNAQAICYDSEKTLAMLKTYKRKVPFVVQLFGNDIGYFGKAAKIIEEKIKPDGIDINLGCPAPKIVKNNCGVELFRNPVLAKEIISEVINTISIPVSIKVRVRVGDFNLLDFLDYVKDLDIKAIMIHGRTLAQGFSGGFNDIDFDIIKKAKEKFKGMVIGNGGIKTYQNAEELINRTGVDGVAIGQASLGKPWIFNEIKERKKFDFSEKKIIKIALKQAKLMKKLKGDSSILEMRKHLAWYVAGFGNAKSLRRDLVLVKTVKDIKEVFKNHK